MPNLQSRDNTLGREKSSSKGPAFGEHGIFRKRENASEAGTKIKGGWCKMKLQM